MSTYTLTYRKDRSQEICVETIENVGKDVNLYFNQEYDEAIKLIKEIIVLQGIRDEEECRERNEGANNKPNNKRDVAKYGCNNRILFAGQRGCGKTSVMRSLAEYLAKHKITINYDGDKDDVKVRCCCLPMVDPSHFDNNNNILLTVITSMFSVAKGYMKEFGDKNDTADREDLLRQFETVFKSLDSIKSEITSYTLESLNRKSDAEDLRKKMNDLVAKYLKYIVGDKESRLVLLIDDIDMSVSYAPEMLEQLRKYLELDNLIILMSANLGQLSNEMREKYSSAFQYTLKDSNQALSIDVEDLATKYLLKLFPTSRRVNVERHVSQLLKTRLRIMGNKHNGHGEEKTVMEDDFQKVILSLIWSKTRLLFIPKDSENTLHPIIPTNLRDLAQFLDMLTTLDKVESGEDNLFKDYDEYDKCNKNLQLFKRYVMHTWIPNHLAIEEELVFKNIPTDITEINKHLINSINVIGTMHKTRLMSREVSLDMIERNAENVNIDRDIYTMVSPNDPKFVKANKISDIFNQPSNYSYGDLLLMIDKYETYFESEEDRRFTDAIKIYYSILLFETMFFKSNMIMYDMYNEVSHALNEEDIKKIIEKHRLGDTVIDDDLKQVEDIRKQIYKEGLSANEKNNLKSKLLLYLGHFVNVVYQSDKEDYLDDKKLLEGKLPEFPSQIIPIQKLIGGTVYYPNYFEIIIDKNFNQKGPSFDAKRAFYHKIKVNDNGCDVGKEFPFFAVLYYGDIRPDRYEKDHIYDTTFQTNADVDGVHYVTFDILSLLNNMLNPWQTIGRLDNPSLKKTMFNRWSKQIYEWGNINQVGECHFPNAVLPFYSVDIMLHYLAQSYQTSRVIANTESSQETYDKEKELIQKGKKMFLLTEDDAHYAFMGFVSPLYISHCIDIITQSNIDKKEIDNKIDNIIKGCYKDAKVLNSSDNSIALYNNILDVLNDFSELVKAKNNSSFVECKQCMDNYINKHKDVYDYSKNTLTHNLQIIDESYKRYKNIISSSIYKEYPETTRELYLSYVIALIIGHFLGSKKDRDGLIKDLHKFNTITEIYKHLVEALWDNAITELLIRSDIQKNVRKHESVQNYYDLLWQETQMLLQKEGIPSDPYQNIYDIAKDKFLSNKI